jgi:hypothetical protein
MEREAKEELDRKLLASWVQRRVARPVLRALGGDVLQQWSNAPSFDPISTDWKER